jgi:hypothetical protein
MRAVLGVSMFLLTSVAGTPKARGTALPNRRTRLGFTYGNALVNKSDSVENFLHSLVDQFCDIQPDKGNWTK